MPLRPDFDADPPDDALSAALSELRAVRGRFYASRVAPGWSLRFPPAEGCVVHLVRGGHTRIWVGGEVYPIRDAELLLLPHGDAHALGDRPDGHEVGFPQQSSVRRDWSAGHPDAVDLVCGEVVLRESAGLPLLASLPRVLRVGADDPADGVIRVLVEQADRQGPGASAMVARLMEVLVVHAVRSWATAADGVPAWVLGARDPVVGRALAAIHARPEAPWTVEALARVGGSSRSRFAERFADLLGVAPMGWVQRVRIGRASDDLARGDRVSEVAARWGYASPAAFSRAYKRSTGRTPRGQRAARE
ncbi:MAG: AraC family transcriptional regulator [Alphaproteobacteria bacterium]|nr:AraC family transcriptional regulator [Alphaproteobacteria bacterium]